MDPIEHFVRDTLGCRCPDEVLRSISIDHLYAADGATPYTRLIVGNRLLIYVLEAESGGVARRAFDRAAGGDQRAHLHCLSRALLPAEVAPRPPEDVVLVTIGVAGRTFGNTR